MGLSTQMPSSVLNAVDQVVFGKTDIVQCALAALLARSHVLFEDVPGLAKTHLVKNLSTVLGLSFHRVQATPDLLPSDVTGVSIFNPKTADFEYRPGPVFCNLLLVDELNRATPRTQSALLECMAERQVTADGWTRALPDPFIVFATQNPIESECTFPLPEAQLDRFAMRLQMGYPTEVDEARILDLADKGSVLARVHAVTNQEEVQAAINEVEKVEVHPQVRAYIVSLVRATRQHPDVKVGCSPRAGIDLFRLSRSFAWINGQSHVDPEAAKFLVPRVFEHRLILKSEARLRGRTPNSVVADVLARIPLPNTR
ncbi:MAG: MoxR family ATPase [bacterium]